MTSDLRRGAMIAMRENGAIVRISRPEGDILVWAETDDNGLIDYYVVENKNDALPDRREEDNGMEIRKLLFNSEWALE